MSFLEMLDVVNEDLIRKGEDAIAFDSDCREGICGACGCMINGVAHGPDAGTTTCQLHMRRFTDGQTIVIEPWRAKAFPVLKDLTVDRTAFDRIIAAGGYISAGVGGAQDANNLLVPKDKSDAAMDSAACIGCGACVAACKNAAAHLFTSAKITHLALLPQGEPERELRAVRMVGSDGSRRLRQLLERRGMRSRMPEADSDLEYREDGEGIHKSGVERSLIFISYRRGDSAGYAGRLHESLERRLGDGHVFRDVDELEPGQDFVDAITARLRECAACLVMIGQEWLHVTDHTDRRRLEQPDDYVRLEIEAALARPDILVVPVLVEGTAMPSANDLPDTIRALSRRHALSLRDETWDADVDRLVTTLEKKIGDKFLGFSSFRLRHSRDTSSPRRRPERARIRAMPSSRSLRRLKSHSS